MTAAALSQDKDPNPDGVSTDTLERVLDDAGPYAYIHTIFSAISNVNKKKRFDFCL
jgi:hypothetical protein